MPSTGDIKYSFSFDSTTITYNLGASYWNGDFLTDSGIKHVFDGNTKVQLTDALKNVFTSAFASWDHYSTFSISSTTGTADIYAYSANTSTYGNLGVTGYFGDNNSATTARFPAENGTYTRAEIAISNSNTSFANTNIATWAALHEIGHALGLDGDAAISGVGGFTTDMSIMSYNIPNSGLSIDAQGNVNYASFALGRFAVTPMAYDIAAIEEKYGANTAATGNDIYAASNNWFTGANRAFTIQDTGGTDTFNVSGIKGNHKINLREAIDASGKWTNSPTIVDGKEYVYIARGSVIENAIGGSGNDTIFGNDSIGVDANHAVAFNGANSIVGGAGDDLINGLSGNDTINGGANSDYLDGGIGNDSLLGDTGDDALIGLDGDDILDGGTDNDIFDGGIGDDILDGGTGTDSYIFSGAYGRYAALNAAQCMQ